ncbi:MAG: hypothetical protein WAT70_09955, partial [Rhizobiaceae bacterium]
AFDGAERAGGDGEAHEGGGGLAGERVGHVFLLFVRGRLEWPVRNVSRAAARKGSGAAKLFFGRCPAGGRCCLKGGGIRTNVASG